VQNTGGMQRLNTEDNFSKVKLQHIVSNFATLFMQIMAAHFDVFFIHGGARVDVLQQLPPAGVVHAQVKPPFRLKSVLQTANKRMAVKLFHHTALSASAGNVVPSRS
jgi:hypothetical protein